MGRLLTDPQAVLQGDVRILKKKRGKRTVLAVTALVLISILISAAAILCINPHYIYIAGEYLGVNCKKVKITKADPAAMTFVALEELKASDDTEFNQSLMLINGDYTLAEDFVPDLSEYKDTQVFMNSCMQEAYAKLSAAVKENTDSVLYVSSDFRTAEQQKQEYANDPSAAVKPGASEHQGGLALDVYIKNYAGQGFIKSEAGQFVNSHSWKYGFIIRYPSFGKGETEIGFEPWHIRYVGEPHAKIIYNNHLTLEEYILALDKGIWYEAEGYLISRQELSKDGTLELPKDHGGAVISPDNTGSYIITIMERNPQ